MSIDQISHGVRAKKRGDGVLQPSDVTIECTGLGGGSTNPYSESVPRSLHGPSLGAALMRLGGRGVASGVNFGSLRA